VYSDIVGWVSQGARTNIYWGGKCSRAATEEDNNIEFERKGVSIALLLDLTFLFRLSSILLTIGK